MEIACIVWGFLDTTDQQLERNFFMSNFAVFIVAAMGIITTLNGIASFKLYIIIYICTLHAILGEHKII